RYASPRRAPRAARGTGSRPTPSRTFLCFELPVTRTVLRKVLVETETHDRLLRRTHLVEAAHGPRVRPAVQELRLVRRLEGDREHRLDERVEGLLGLRLRRLDHQRLGHDEGEVDR